MGRMANTSAEIARVVLYARQSRARDDESEASPTSQLDACRSFAAARGWAVVGEFSDVGLSGYDPAVHRAGFESAISSIETGRADAVVVHYLSRLTRRGAGEATRIYERLNSVGGSIVSVSEPIDTSTPIGRGIFALLASMAEQEAVTIGARSAAAKAVVAAAGGWTGGQRPYGYRSERVQRGALNCAILVEDPEESSVIRELASHILDGASLTGEARRLNQAGVPGTRGVGQWSAVTVRRLMTNPRMMGYRASGVPPVIERDEVGEPILEHQAIIDPETWYRLQEVIRGRGRGRGPRGSQQHLLGGLDWVVCARCGGSLSGRREAGQRSSYACSRQGVGRPCPGVRISMDRLEEYLVDVVAQSLHRITPHNTVAWEQLRSYARQLGLINPDPQLDAERDALRGLVSDAENSLDQLDDDRAAGMYPGELGERRYHRQVEARTARYDAAVAALAALPQGDSGEPELEAVVRLGVDAFYDRSAPGGWDTLDITTKHIIMHLVLSRVTIMPHPEGAQRSVWRPRTRVKIEPVFDLGVGVMYAAEDAPKDHKVTK